MNQSLEPVLRVLSGSQNTTSATCLCSTCLPTFLSQYEVVLGACRHWTSHC